MLFLTNSISSATELIDCQPKIKNQMNDNWYYLDGSNSVGPITASSLCAAIAQGTINVETLVWREGMQRWSPIRTIPDLGRMSPPPPPQVGEIVGGRPGLDVPRPLRIVGSRVLLAEGYQLPDSYCVCCGSPSVRRYKRSFGYTPPAVWIAVIAPFILIILLLCLRKERKLSFGLCNEHAQRTLIMNLICWGSGFLFIPIWIWASSINDSSLSSAVGILGFVLFVNWIVFCNLARPLKVEGLENGYIKIRGVCAVLRKTLKG